MLRNFNCTILLFKKDIFYFLIALVCLSACSRTKSLSEGEYLLSKTKLEGNKELSTQSLTALYKQKPNTRVLGLPIPLYLYNFGSSFFDSSKVQTKIEKTTVKYDRKIEDAEKPKKREKLLKNKEEKLEKLQSRKDEGNWLMRLGSSPVVYDSSLTNQTLRTIRYYITSHGYMEGGAFAEIDTSGKTVKVTYTIYEGKPYILKEVLYKVEDERIDSLIRNNLKESPLKIGEVYEEPNLTAERERLFRLMKNNGYYDFTAQYIEFNVDTTQERRKVVVQLVLKNPPGAERHNIYTVDQVYFTTDVNLVDSSQSVDTSSYKNIHYAFGSKRFSKRILNKRIKIRPGEIYDQSEIQTTQKLLSGLDTYRSVDISVEEDTTNFNEHRLIVKVNAFTLKKHEISVEGGLNVYEGFTPGPFISLNYRERNLFGGFELLDLRVRASIAGQAGVLDPGNVLKTEEYNLNLGLTLPQFIFPTKLRNRFSDYNPRTTFLTGYTILRRPEYERAALQGAMTYNFTTSPYAQLTISPVDISLINTANISDRFELFLRQLQGRGNNLIYAFQNSYVSNINASYVFNNNILTENNKSRYTRLYAESGGTLLNIYDPIASDDLQTFRYIKLNTDLRYYFPVNESTFAMRLNVGYANPYGANLVLPYEKYFFAGGTNSIRAWRPRRLGPGSYAPLDLGGEIDYTFERPGEILLETSYEYRFPIVGFFDGAIFVDAGNVWALRSDESRPGAEFQVKDFLSEIAVGTGVGLRLNLSFLILRLDLGIKLYDPALKSVVLFSTGLKESVINFGIGYPF